MARDRRDAIDPRCRREYRQAGGSSGRAMGAAHLHGRFDRLPARGAASAELDRPGLGPGGARCSQDQAQKDRLANPDNHASGLLHQVYENRRIVGPVDAPIFIRTDSRTPGARGLRRILTGCGQSCVRLPASPRTGGTTCERYVFETPFTDGHNKGRYFVSKRRQPSQSGGRPARL